VALKTVKVAVVGVGSLGQHHARIYSELPEAELAGVYDIESKRAQEIAIRYHTRRLSSLEETTAHAEAASVVVPTTHHFAIASQLLRAGLHVLIEKPITSTTQEAEILVELAEKNRLILQVGHVERFNPVLSFLQAMPSKARFIEVHRLAPYPPAREGRHPRGTEVNVVLDLMIHDLEIILYLVRSPIREIRAVGVPVLSQGEDIANVRILFDDGCVANITASRITPEPLRRLRVFLEEAYVSLDYQNQKGEIRRKIDNTITREAVAVQKGEPLANELRSFVQCVATRDQPVVSGAQAAEALKLAIDITRRMREGPS
jgi:predicted dehydrogenase